MWWLDETMESIFVYIKNMWLYDNLIRHIDPYLFSTKVENLRKISSCFSITYYLLHFLTYPFRFFFFRVSLILSCIVSTFTSSLFNLIFLAFCFLPYCYKMFNNTNNIYNTNKILFKKHYYTMMIYWKNKLTLYSKVQ